MAWVIAFLNGGWTLQWMTWSQFLKTILAGDFYHILNIPNLKLMAGGFSLAIDYMYLIHPFIFILTLNLCFSSSSTSHPGLDNSNFDRFWKSLLQLSLQLPMFPHPLDLIASASKIQRDNLLMVVASTITQTPFPKSLTLPTKDALLKACANRGLVIKREFSDSEDCTFLPPKREEDLEKRKRRVKEVWDHTKTLYEGIESLPPPTWMGQPFILSLLEKGELRAFVVGGRVTHVVHTCPQHCSQEFVDSFVPLSLIR